MLKKCRFTCVILIVLLFVTGCGKKVIPQIPSSTKDDSLSSDHTKNGYTLIAPDSIEDDRENAINATDYEKLEELLNQLTVQTNP